MPVTRTVEGGGVGEVPSSQPENRRVLLPWWGWVALVAVLCSVVPVAGYAVEGVGWNRIGVRVFAWAVMAAAAVAVTLRYANPLLPALCGGMVGAQAPRPSEAWVRQFAGDSLGGALSLAFFFAAIAIGIAVFTALAKRRVSEKGRF